MIREEDFEAKIEESIRETNYLKEMYERKKKEDEALFSLEGDISAKEDKVVDTITRLFGVHGFLSKPFAERVSDTNKVDFKKVWDKLPIEWTANASPYHYEDATGTKEHKDKVSFDYQKLRTSTTKEDKS